MANNNYPQITSVTSEALQAQIRNLLPSQEGFGTDLMAQNVIVPVIDLTSAAEGSSVPQNLQTALAFGSQTAFSQVNGSSTIINTTGFYRIIGTADIISAAAASLPTVAHITATDGATTKTIWGMTRDVNGAFPMSNTAFDFLVFVNSGESIGVNASAKCTMVGSTRQIADINGVLVNPSGFSPQ